MQKLFQQAVTPGRRAAVAMSADLGERAGGSVFAGAKISPELLHQDVMLLGICRAPLVGNLT
ncbi:MAG: hypothetical protein RLO21_08265, partial [Nitratireductor sp.]